MPASATTCSARWRTRRRVRLGGDNGVKAPRIAFTTDSFVVRPLFFPGGDIGRLAVHGTVNDLAVGGARPLFLSAAFILEEGLPLADLRADRRLDAARPATRPAWRSSPATPRSSTAARATASSSPPPASASCRRAVSLSIRAARPGDRILVSGTLGDHGIAIMSVREGLEFETVLESDTAPLHGLTEAMLEACPRDPLHARPDARRPVERAERAGRRPRASASTLDEAAIPLRPEVRGRLRDARARPALRRQRGQADRRRAAGGCRPRCWRRCGRIRSGRNAAIVGDGRGRPSGDGDPCGRASAASGSSRCWPESNCRGSADGHRRPPERPGTGSDLQHAGGDERRAQEGVAADPAARDRRGGRRPASGRSAACSSPACPPGSTSASACS